MRIKTLLIVLFATFSISANAQNFATWSGTIRIGGGLYGTMYSYITPLTVGLLQAFKVTDFDVNQWSSQQHTFWRFFNVGGDILVPRWTMTGSNTNIELHRPLEDYQTNFLNDTYRQYTNYVGYWINWKSHYSGFGGFFGIDYEWKSFLIFYPYSNSSCNKIQSIVPTVGLRYRLISPMKEIEGFPINVVPEAGVSYVVNVKYDNYDGYGLKALNNGFRLMLGIAITTNRYGSIHLRWTKDLYNLFNNDYSTTNGPLFDNEIYNNFNCFSIGWAIFI